MYNITHKRISTLLEKKKKKEKVGDRVRIELGLSLGFGWVCTNVTKRENWYKMQLISAHC